MMKLTATASIFAATLAAKQNKSRNLKDYCYFDAGYYNFDHDYYVWSSSARNKCPDTYSSEYGMIYTCDKYIQEVCEDDSYYAYDKPTDYDSYYGEYYDAHTNFYKAGSYSEIDDDEAAAAAAAAGMGLMMVLVWVAIVGCTPLCILFCCLCMCGVCGKKCCWYDCYGCKKDK